MRRWLFAIEVEARRIPRPLGDANAELLAPLLLVRAESIDGPKPQAGAVDEVLEVRGQPALGINPVRQPGEDVAHLPAMKLGTDALEVLVLRPLLAGADGLRIARAASP